MWLILYDFITRFITVLDTHVMLLIKAFDVGHKMCSKPTNVKLFKILKQIRKHGSGILYRMMIYS